VSTAELTQLCQDPTQAALAAVDLVNGMLIVAKHSIEEAIARTGATADDFKIARYLRRHERLAIEKGERSLHDFPATASR
jgi:hypothetical protein